MFLIVSALMTYSPIVLAGFLPGHAFFIVYLPEPKILLRPENTVGCNHEIVKRAVSQSSIVSGAQYTPVSPKSFWRAGIGGASRPLPEWEQERPRLSATRLRRPRPKWPRPRRRSRSLPPRRTQNRPTRGKLPASRFPTDRPVACLDCWFRGRP
jgi:hypothetical protein